MVRTGHTGAVTATEVLALLERVRSGSRMSEVLRDLTRMCARIDDGARAWLELREPSGPLVMTSWPVAPLQNTDVLFDGRGPGTRPLAAGDALRSLTGARWGARSAFRCGEVEGVLVAVSDVTDEAGLVEHLTSLGSAAGAIVHAWDTERRLKELSERHWLVSQATQHVIYDWDVSNDTVTWNPRMSEVFGHTESPDRDRMAWWKSQLHPDDQERAWTALQRALKERELYWTQEYRFRRADATYAWVFDRAAIVYDADSRAVRMLGAMEDISRDRELESKLTLASRLAAVGSLASGIAHEINNPLAWVTSNLAFALDELKQLSREVKDTERTEELAEALDDAQTGAARIAQIVNDLRTFAHADHEKVSPVSVRRVVEGALTMANNELKHRSRIVKRLDHVPMVLANEARLGQAIVNLLLNAAWSAGMPGRAAEVVISTATSSHGQAVIEVTDNGPPFAPEVLPRIFDPFYAARPGPEGIGLGLAVTHSIVSGVGGTIAVESDSTRGTTFRITLPQVPEDQVVAPAASPQRSATRPLIFVIDDERPILTAIERMLGSSYEVQGFELGHDALETLAQRQPDVILCDVMMPEMSGADFYSRLKTTWPQLVDRVVLLTGGAFTREAQVFIEGCPAPVVEKPFTLRSLKDAIGRIVSH